METLEQYFARPDSPAAASPVGTIMLKVLAKYPELDFEAARVHAKELLASAAKGRVYRTPRVLSAAEQAERSARLKTVFQKVPQAA